MCLLWTAALLWPDPSWAQAVPQTCIANNGYPWPQFGCVKATDLNAAIASRAPLAGATFTGPVVLNGTNQLTVGGPAVAPGGGYSFGNRVNTIVNRLSDRLFVGQALNANDGSTNPQDWLAKNTDLAYQSFWPQLEVLSTTGTLAITGAVRSSDQGPGGASIALNGIAINDVVGRADAWGGYYEAHRNNGNTGFTQGVELDIVNFASTVDVTPYSEPAGSSFGLLLQSGGGLSPPFPGSVAGLVGNNSATWRKGWLFLNNALDPGVGAGGGGVAVEMAPGQSVRWIDNNAATLAEFWGNSSGLHVSGTTSIKPPTSCAGQPSGTLWNNGGTAAFCP